MTAPLVSIIVPVCNGEASIGDALTSALGQTYKNVEVVVVDDGSRDRTAEIVDTIARRDGRVRLVTQDNRGVAAARNRALTVASGELIATLDADDLWDPQKIARQARRMLEAGDDTGLVYCWWIWIDERGRVLDSSPSWRVEGDAADTLVRVNVTGCASVPMFRRRSVDEVGGYDETFRSRDAEGCEDWDLALRIAERARVAVEAACLVAYRRHRGAMSTGTARMWRSHALVVDGVQRRRPHVSPTVLQRSADQFALHLAGVSLWSGRTADAVRWTLSARRSRLPLQILRYMPRVLMRAVLLSNGDGRPPIRPGTAFSTWPMPRPLVPYDRIEERARQARPSR